jgi:hypothetical protein
MKFAPLGILRSVMIPLEEEDQGSSPVISGTALAISGLIKTDLGGIAQLGERLHGMQEVRGSSPLTSTNFTIHESVPEDGTRGQGFEPYFLHQFYDI